MVRQYTSIYNIYSSTHYDTITCEMPRLFYHVVVFGGFVSRASTRLDAKDSLHEKMSRNEENGIWKVMCVMYQYLIFYELLVAMYHQRNITHHATYLPVYVYVLTNSME